jgi:hypothetical protein
VGRIRTVKPELAAHEGMFDAEKETGLPLRFAWVMLFTVADREGRFQWRPRTLKSQILPHDEIEFSRVLDAWVTRGFVRKYRVRGEWFGVIPSWKRHQVINNRETPSDIPSPDEDDSEINDLDACATRERRVDDASPTRAVHAQAEGKGREGKGREGKGREGNGRAHVGAEANGSSDTFGLLTKLQAIYPAGVYTGVTWHQAERELSKLLEAGEPEELILANTTAYRDQQLALGKVGTEFIRSPKSFFADGHWRGPFPLPAPAENGTRRKSYSPQDRVTWTPTE